MGAVAEREMTASQDRGALAKMVMALLDHWKLSTEDQAALLGIAAGTTAGVQAMLVFIGENAQAISTRYGLVSTTSIGAIQRRLLVLENQGGAQLFGEPALALSDLMLADAAGRGRVNLLAAD